MRIGIPAEGDTPDALLCERFGRAPWILVVDGDAVVAVRNHLRLDAAQGAGIQTAQAVLDAGAELILARHVGPKAHRVLAAGAVPVHLVEAGSCRQALAAYRAGRTPPVTEADVEGHW